MQRFKTDFQNECDEKHVMQLRSVVLLRVDFSMKSVVYLEFNGWAETSIEALDKILRGT